MFEMKDRIIKIFTPRRCVNLIIISVFATFFMFGIDFISSVIPNKLFFSILILLSIVEVLSYLGFVLWYIYSWKGHSTLLKIYNALKLLILSIMILISILFFAVIYK